MTDTAALVERSLSEETSTIFERRVRRQADDLRNAIEAGEFDNAEFAIGLEVEVYAVDAGSSDGIAGEHGQLAEIPETVFEGPANKELGLHNAELNTDPNVFDGDGLSAQASAIADRLEAARAAAGEAGLELVSDAMWTVPPPEGSHAYLADVDVEDGVTIAGNMRPDPRYVAIDNDVLARSGGEISFEVPGATHSFPSILFESLATSIQPHLQIPSAEALPAHYNAAIRTLGPVLALSTNSPFLPGDLYDDVDDPTELVKETHHELRIAAFEQSVNASPNPKVRVPRDIETATDVVDRIVDDDRYAPFLREWIDDSERNGLRERYWEFDYRRSTYWRWLRCVVGGDPVGNGDERSLRIEYRPVPTQPTVRDVVGMQALTAGLVRGLVAADHPIAELPWADAEASFYAAVEDGLDADLAWVGADGDRTTDSEAIFEDVFAHARRGLAESGVPVADIDRYLQPIERRWAAGTTPSVWKQERVREGLEEGLPLAEAIEEMQREYRRLSRETESFAEWL